MEGGREEVIRISEAKDSPKRQKLLGKFNDISGGDENK
jgi:hypothetical protein